MKWPCFSRPQWDLHDHFLSDQTIWNKNYIGLLRAIIDVNPGKYTNTYYNCLYSLAYAAFQFYIFNKIVVQPEVLTIDTDSDLGHGEGSLWNSASFLWSGTLYIAFDHSGGSWGVRSEWSRHRRKSNSM